jgi:hypothetical protein
MNQYAGGAAAAAAAAIANAIKASGAIIRVEPEDFKLILSKSSDALVVTATGGVFTKNFQYLTSYKGLTFFTKSSEPIRLESRVETIACKKIWIPG